MFIKVLLLRFFIDESYDTVPKKFCTSQIFHYSAFFRLTTQGKKNCCMMLLMSRLVHFNSVQQPTRQHVVRLFLVTRIHTKKACDIQGTYSLVRIKKDSCAN